MDTFQPAPSAWRGIEPLTKSGHDLVISIHVLCMGGYYLNEANNEASQEFQSIPSVWRVTNLLGYNNFKYVDFNPHPSHGE